MKTFHVYEHPARRYEAVKQGFSWPGFFFTTFWALFKKMWGLFCLFLTINILLALIFSGGSDAEIAINGVCTIVFMVIFGAKGNDWRKRRLLKHGFEKLDIVEAETKDAAIAWAVKLKNA